MSEHRPSVSRRDVLKAGSAAAALAASGSLLNAAETVTSAPASRQASLPDSKPLPTRPLGRTGAQVSVLNLGCGKAHEQRMLDEAYRLGVRYFDTAAGYANGKSEQQIGAWFERTGKRKEIFLVTKCHPVDREKKTGDLRQMLDIVDKRLNVLKTDYIDLFFVHGINTKEYGEQALDWPRSREFKEVAEALRKSGKVRYVGFSCHDAKAPQYMMAAAEGGFLDAIMMSYNPVAGRKKDEALDKAMDACHKAGIGLIAMKSVRGIKPTINVATLGDLNAYQAVIKATLSDPRVASVCSAMENFKQLEENSAAARTIDKPMTEAEIEHLRQLVLAAGPAYCPGCDACRSGIAAVHPEAHEVTRYLSYFEQDGNRPLARELYRALPAEALAIPAEELEAARRACAYGVDYPALLARAAEKLA